MSWITLDTTQVTRYLFICCLQVVVSPRPFSRVQVKQTVVFLLMVLIYSTLIELPWAVYMTFVLEERHGFNKQVTVGK